MEESDCRKIWEGISLKPQEVRIGHGIGIWKSIVKYRDEFMNYIRFDKGQEEIKFWEDLWC